jgi:endoglycosylceramidase
MLSQSVLSVPSFHSSGSVPYILDEFNRARFFHGSNFVNKGFPWYAESLLNETNVEILANMGMNTVRLGFMWTGAQPESGDSFNSTYFDMIDQIVDNLVKHKIYPFLDVHQDVMSSYFCLYDAFPKWAVDQSDISKHEFPWPLKTGVNDNPCPIERGWGQNYLSDACGTAFQTLYNEGSSFEASFFKFWQKTAEHFNDKPILGYELINEPWAGDIYTDPALLLPAHAGNKNLLPFYDRLTNAIREKDINHLIFYEPVTWGMIFNGDILGSGFDHVPGGITYQNASVFSFHYYCWWYSDTTNDMQRKTCDSIFGPKVFEQVIRETKQLGGAAMLTEWGQACDYDNEDVYNDQGECNAIMAFADDHLISWTDWYFGERLSGSNFGSLTENGRRIFSRIYAQAIAGRPIANKYDVTTRSYNLCFVQHDDITSSITEIFVPFAAHFPEGIDITTSTDLEVVKVDVDGNQVWVKNRAVKLPKSCVIITPKSS